MNQLNVLSFFSGAMGLDLGLERAGMITRLACEFDGPSRSTISSNRPDLPLLDDIWNYSASDILEASGLSLGKVDVVAGGPPCQAFSTAGKRKGFSDPRGNVFLKYIELVGELSPRYVVIENVRGLLSAADNDFQSAATPAVGQPGSALLRVIKLLESSGYNVSFNLYNAANFGTPQKRERVVLIGTTREDPVPYLTPTHSAEGAGGLQPWTTFRQATEGLAADGPGLNFPTSRIRFYKMLDEGQNWRNLPQELQREALGNAYLSGGGRTGFLRRLAWDKPAPTLVTNPTMPATDLAHPVEDRPLSVAEYKRIQQFPDSWSIQGNVQAQYRQIGNAVPVGLGEAIGRTIARHAAGAASDLPFPSHVYSRYRRTGHEEWMSDVLSRAGKSGAEFAA